MQQNDMTEGKLLPLMMRFSVPYLIACFLQTFYGMADLFITGQFNGADSITAVSVGSQITHMLTVVIVGLAMGTTVSISHRIGAKDQRGAARAIGNSAVIFLVFALAATVILQLLTGGILSILSTPEEAFREASQYLRICFVGIPFITAYNVLSSIFRGMGDTKRPMYFVAIAGVINVALDYLLIGPMHMGAAGAASATVISQACSVVLAFLSLRRQSGGVRVTRADLMPERETVGKILNIGIPIACQEGFIQISFLVITAIANSRGVSVAAAVGIVEKIISFLFLVPSAMLSTVSAVAAQNAGAQKHERGRLALRYGLMISMGFGLIVFGLCQIFAPQAVALFVKNDEEVIIFGGQYLRSYSLDCILAGVHFCFSGYFSAYGRSMYSFIHNLASILLIRIPGAYLASIYFPENLYPMGLAAPMGSLLSDLICLLLFLRFIKKQNSLESKVNRGVKV